MCLFTATHGASYLVITHAFKARVTQSMSDADRGTRTPNFHRVKVALYSVELYLRIAPAGFEPAKTASETVGLPLAYRAL